MILTYADLKKFAGTSEGAKKAWESRKMNFPESAKRGVLGKREISIAGEEGKKQIDTLEQDAIKKGYSKTEDHDWSKTSGWKQRVYRSPEGDHLTINESTSPDHKHGAIYHPAFLEKEPMSKEERKAAWYVGTDKDKAWESSHQATELGERKRLRLKTFEPNRKVDPSLAAAAKRAERSIVSEERAEGKSSTRKFSDGNISINKRQALANIVSPLKDLVGAMNKPGPDGKPAPENPIMSRISKVAAFAKERRERLPDPPEIAMKKLDQALDRSMLFLKQSKEHVGESEGTTDMDVKVGDTVLNAATQKPRGGGVGN